MAGGNVRAASAYSSRRLITKDESQEQNPGASRHASTCEATPDTDLILVERAWRT
jgi:hypothetical protein